MSRLQVLASVAFLAQAIAVEDCPQCQQTAEVYATAKCCKSLGEDPPMSRLGSDPGVEATA